MAKRFVFPFVFFLAVVCLDSFGQRADVVKTYSNEIGVRELTGNNDGQQVEHYLSSTGLGKGYAWCAAFVNWVLKQNNIQGPKSPAWSPAWFPDEHTIANKCGQPGDVFGIYFKSKKRIAHVGFIDEKFNNDKNTILTVEGNTNEAGSREGDGVYRKRRSKNQIYKISCWL